MADELYGGIDNLDVLDVAVRYNRFLVESVIRSAEGFGSAIDFGAGTGTLSAAARSNGLDVVCVEPDPRLRERLTEQGFVVHADLGTVADASQHFIYSLNVLEHIEDDEATLLALFSKLTPGGRLFLYLPAFNILFSSMDRKIGHYRRYGRRGLVEIARHAGFAVVTTEYADSLGFLVTLLYKLVGSRRGDISPASVRLYDRFVFPASRLLDRIGFRRILGKNLMAVLQRPPHKSSRP